MPRHGRGGWGPGRGHGRQRRHSPVATSLLEPALLVLLSDQQSHGYTLLEDLGNLNLGTIHPSMVYRSLREMEALEWVVSAWDTRQSQGPPRRVYQLTPLGKEALETWLEELGKARQTIDQLLARARTANDAELEQ